MHHAARQIKRITGIERQRMRYPGRALLIRPRRGAAWRRKRDVIPNAPGFAARYLQHQHVMRIEMRAKALRAGRRQIDIGLHRMEKHFFEATAKPRKWRMQFMKLRNNQAAPRIIAGKQARQINAAAISLQIFIRRYRSAALPAAIGHAHARMARGIGAQKRIQISDGKQPRVAIRGITRQPSPRCPFTQGTRQLQWGYRSWRTCCFRQIDDPGQPGWRLRASAGTLSATGGGILKGRCVSFPRLRRPPKKPETPVTQATKAQSSSVFAAPQHHVPAESRALVPA